MSQITLQAAALSRAEQNTTTLAVAPQTQQDTPKPHADAGPGGCATEQAQEQVAQKTMSEKSAKSVATKTARLEATRTRMAKRVAAAALRLEKAEEAARLAAARLKAAKAKAAEVARQAAALIAKQEAQLGALKQRHEAAAARAAARTAASRASRALQAAGSLQTESGQTLELTRREVAAVRAAIGRKEKGLLGADVAEEMLSVIDEAHPEPTGDRFTVRMKGRKTAVVFTVETSGLSFATIALANPPNAA